MKKLLPILIGLSLTGFSAMSQAENLLQVYQQARLGNPDLRKSAGRSDLVGSVKHFAGRLVRRRLPIREGLLRARHLVVVVVDFPDDNLPVGLFLPA